MACTGYPLLSSTLYGGTQLHPRRPKTKAFVPHLFHHPRTRPNSVQSFLLPPRNKKSRNSENNSNSELTPSVNAAVASFLLSTLAQQQPLSPALADDLSPPPDSPPVQLESATKPSAPSSPFSQSLLTAPKPQTSPDLPEGSQWRYSEFLNAVKKGKVERVRFSKDGGALQLTAVDGRRATVVVPNDPDLIDILAMNGVDISVSEGDGGNGLFAFIGNLLFPFLAFAGLFFLFRRAQGGPGGGPGGLGGPMDFGRSKSKFQEVPETGVNFADVAGADQAKLELQEVVDFLKNPDKYTALGAKIPKGCLLVGPPGTGKTLLARAVAGEAGVPFFSCAASEFVELFVGVGASRVRDLFEKAKSKAPCIVFIDEIDAVGRQRGAGLGGGNDEREQTINQLLTEMDGFSGNSGVIVLAATNRPDVLDSALLRPGRFDRQVTVDRPDVAGRVKILQVHSRGKALAKDVDFEKIARRTPGFTGADLQNLMNEAAIIAARRDLKEISKDEISDALERIIAGPEKKNAVVSEEKRKLVAYHEAGHALVGALMPEYDPVAKISIIPRGQAGGLTFFAPSEERLESGLYSRSYLENQMAVALGGRVAEEVIFGKDNVTTGASNDFMQVSRVARQMVERFGFSKKIGQVAIGGPGGNPFLGQQMSSQKDYSMATADVVDSEVRELVEKAYSRAMQIMSDNIDILHKLAQLLIEKETVDGEEFMSLFIDGKAELYVA
ncbi:ATP-dependent zinc metalloprotease FTSH 1, chloroplastic-like [Phoenix dactylifera]|uniref:ATP-dependent zinc metalloprotease FTSH 1, chloroplastic-like n=1 Tax=Phoenix dactylifera TaxID=42345 RepID=A0A8B7D335_PHODC|nr:ATP-dependent zinc metalloprotease FTSH 1, chloroplastic-like [Phoenix dactylifera]